jgi:DNA modification methylase
MRSKVAKEKGSYTRSAISEMPSDLSIERYREFLAAKASASQDYGFVIDPNEVHPIAKPHQRDAICWAVRGGRRALFESFGLGKSLQQLEIVRLVLKYAGGRGLIVAPLGVRQEFKRDAEMLGSSVTFVRSMDDVRQRELFNSNSMIYITNYETVRDGKLDPSNFTVTSLDEAAVLRGFGGSKTFREFMRLFESVPYRFIATATPDPNEYIEMLAYSGYLGVMDISQAKTRFFKRDSTKADKLTIHPHKEDEFWLWVSTWALFLQKPSDLGHDDAGYDLPELEVIYHEVQAEARIGQTVESNGQTRMFNDATMGVSDAAREKRDTLPIRIERMKEIVAAEPDKHFILWHTLEPEREAIEKAIPNAATVYGSQELDEREQIVMDFSDGKIQLLAAKPVMLGSGCNLQRHCANAVFVGIGFKFAEFIQAIHRIHRFLQTRQVRIHLIYADTERGILDNLLAKWDRYKVRADKMSEIIKEFGLSQQSKIASMQRAMGTERVEVSGDAYRLINNDCVEEMMQMADNSVGLVLTSIPFSSQYEYTPSYNDFGHSESNAEFFRQMDFLTPHLLRVLEPGRIAAIHVKDRIVPGGMTGLGFQTTYPFHCDVITHYTRHGFAYLGMKTIVTDVVRENNQTYRLGWTEQCKDASKMGVGMPEYLLLFRKPPTDTTNSYADNPVVKLKRKYSRSRWQVDAHAFARSNGNRPPRPEELENLKHDVIFKIFRDYSLNSIYDFDYHVKIGEALEEKRRLPVTFMLLQPASWHPDVWTDITRMRTLNGAQYAKGKQAHLCPMQLDLAERVITQFSMEGETILDPFGGLMTVPMTVPMMAVKLKRRGVGIELNPNYFLDGCAYVEGAAQAVDMPMLFDITDQANAEASADTAA